MDTSRRALTFYSDFFGVSYPLPKYDCIAVADFQYGAMENWGLVSHSFARLVNDNISGLVNNILFGQSIKITILIGM